MEHMVAVAEQEQIARLQEQPSQGNDDNKGEAERKGEEDKNGEEDKKGRRRWTSE